MEKLTIQTVPINKLNPYVNNAKRHPAWQIETICNSIQEFGNCDPVAVWTNPEGELEVIEGHGRLLALKKLGHKQVPIIKLDHLSDEQRRAYTHVHNKLTMNTELDYSTITEEIDNLTFDWESLGFKDLSFNPDEFYESIPDKEESERTCPHCGGAL